MGMPVITPSTTTREQAITDIIESVALQQTALSHILNAEGEKLSGSLPLTALPLKRSWLPTTWWNPPSTPLPDWRAYWR